MKKIWSLCVVFGFIMFGSFVVAAETYTLVIPPMFGSAVYKVAEVKGLWQAQGVDVQLVPYSVMADANRGVGAQRVDLGPGPLAVLAGYRNKNIPDASYLGTLAIADHHKHLVLKQELLNKSLKGCNVGIFLEDNANDFLLSTYLKSVDTRLSDVHLVEMNSKTLQINFQRNRLQVILDVDRKNQVYEKAGGVVALSTHDFYEPHGLLLVKEGGLAAIPTDDLKKIMRGCVEAIQWTRNPANKEEYKAILKEFFLNQLPDLSDEQFYTFITDMKFVAPRELLEHNQTRLPEYFTEFRTFLEEEHLMTSQALEDFTYENVIRNQVLIEVLQEYAQ